MRTVVALLIAAALVLGVVFFWFAAPDDTPGSTAAAPSTSTTTITSSSQPSPTSSAAAATSTSTAPTSHIVETEEEAEAILRDLWFGWFEGIYQQDEDRIREVVASEHQVDLARDQFGAMTFRRAPEPTDLAYSNTRVLLADDQCTVILTTASFSGFAEGDTTDVHVLRWVNGWRFFSLWSQEADLWETDCSAESG